MLASPVRLHLLWLLPRRESDVSGLADRVIARRIGKRPVYAVDEDHVIVPVEQALDHHAARRH